MPSTGPSRNSDSYVLETDATHDQLMSVVRDVVGHEIPASQSGRLGLEIIGTRVDLDLVRQALELRGRTVYLEAR